ncbi:hypothetical protein M406DRAFT_67108 [Cryphonectria parasitica EP155]|uniref:Secreted protein n=1 Tax=Cryphonectria parasitica (strain ATCC 38755 / EP155) TaxID=660469 RepID=A0A9P4YCB2_CRYP1|nr:uncharacterized protein M406DRAFT_67108 [Cryphonectria parasitica EP155]KAF3770728.1 hypothetical protein M406DRAFT_67108 [Cryphonectria parasitica EP155]
MRAQVFAAIVLLQLQNCAAAPTNADTQVNYQHAGESNTHGELGGAGKASWQGHQAPQQRSSTLEVPGISEQAKGMPDEMVFPGHTQELSHSNSGRDLPVSELIGPVPVPELEGNHLIAKRCMTEAQIEAFQASWSPSAGRGPELVQCSDSTVLKRTPLSSSEFKNMLSGSHKTAGGFAPSANGPSEGEQHAGGAMKAPSA